MLIYFAHIETSPALEKDFKYQSVRFFGTQKNLQKIFSIPFSMYKKPSF